MQSLIISDMDYHEGHIILHPDHTLYPWRRSCHHFAKLVQLISDLIALMVNLRRLSLYNISREQGRSPHLFCQQLGRVHIPRLEHVDVSGGLQGQCCIRGLIRNRNAALRSVQLSMMMTKVSDWIGILEDMKTLHLDAEVVISKPQLIEEAGASVNVARENRYDGVLAVRFTPADDDKEAHTVGFLKGNLLEYWKWMDSDYEIPNALQYGFHYIHEPGQLQEALKCMRRNCRVLISRSQLAKAMGAQPRRMYSYLTYNTL